MKTEELNALKNEVKALNKKLAELTEEELAQVAGGVDFNTTDWNGYCGLPGVFPLTPSP